MLYKEAGKYRVVRTELSDPSYPFPSHPTSDNSSQLVASSCPISDNSSRFIASSCPTVDNSVIMCNGKLPPSYPQTDNSIDIYNGKCLRVFRQWIGRLAYMK